MSIRIVPMAERHLTALAEIERACFHEPWSADALREELAAGHPFLTAEDETGEVLGYVGCQTVLDEGYITNVAVAPAARRRGAGRALLDELTRQAQARGLSFVTLEVRVSNAAAIALYEGAGYARVGVRKRFYTAPTEDALLMTLYLKEQV